MGLEHCGSPLAQVTITTIHGLIVQDEANRKGGKWILRLRKGIVNRYWEDIVLAVIGEQVRAVEATCLDRHLTWLRECSLKTARTFAGLCLPSDRTKTSLVCGTPRHKTARQYNGYGQE